MRNDASKLAYAGRTLSFTALVLGISACSNQQAIHFSIVKEANQCRMQNAMISAFSDHQDQNKLIKTLSGFSKPEAAQALKQLFQKHSESENLFLVSQGQKSSAGYGFKLTGNTGSVIDETLTLPITFTSPEPGSMSAQVMTSPCLVLGIDSKAQFKHLVIDSLKLTISN